MSRSNGAATAVMPEASKKMKYAIEVIGPDRARELLKKNKRNRKVAQATVEGYAADMVAGLWQLTGEPIQIGSKGTILNGQHRLHAVILAGTDVTFSVLYGCSEGNFKVIDQPRKRNAVDLYVIDGGKLGDVNRVVGTAAAMLRGIGGGDRARAWEVAKHARDNEDVIDEVVQALRSDIQSWSSAVSGAFANAVRRHGSDVATPLAERYAKQQWSEDLDPLKALRRCVIDSKLSRKDFRPGWEIYRLAVSAINAAIEERPVQRLHPSQSDF